MIVRGLEEIRISLYGSGLIELVMLLMKVGKCICVTPNGWMVDRDGKWI